MRKKFISDFFFIQALNLLIKPVWLLVIDRKVQNLLPTEEYGTYFSLFGFSLLFMIVLDMGLSNFNNREVAINENFYSNNFWSIITTKAILTFLFFILGMLTGLIIGFTTFDFTIFGLLAINQTLLSFNTYLRSNISAIHKFKVDGILSIADRLFVVISLGCIIWTSILPISLNIYVFILAQTIGLIITFIMAWMANMKLLGKPDYGFNKKLVIPLLKAAFPYAGIIALMTIYTRIDSVLILKLLPDGRHQAGTYAMGYRLLDAAGIIGLLLAGQLLPLFSSNLMNKARLKSMVKWTSILVFIPAVLASLTCAIGSPFIMKLLYPEKYTIEAGLIFGILIFCIPGMVLVNIFGTLLTAAGQVNRINFIAFIACIINIGGNLIFIPIYGLTAVAITAVITQLFFGGICWWWSRKVYV